MNAEKYRRWFEYEEDSNAKVLASLQAVADPLRVLPLFQKAVDLLAHLVAWDMGINRQSFFLRARPLASCPGCWLKCRLRGDPILRT